MKVNDLRNLWVGFNEAEKYTALICALDEQEAYEIAEEYKIESYMGGIFIISEFTDVNTKFDCDYVLSKGY